MTRRKTFWLAGGAAAGGAALLSRPADRSGPRDEYFLRLQKALHDAGVTTPSLVIDRARLNANIDTLLGHLPPGMGYRIVAKSLPSPDLIAHVRQRSKSARLMTFNLPMLTDLSRVAPDADQLLGKPLPVRAAQIYFTDLKEPSAAEKVQWLIDTPDRLQQYEALARGMGLKLRINLELDIGLHRGGFAVAPELDATLAAIERSPHLQFSGFMGYEPHITALPSALGLRDRACDMAWTAYRAALEMARAKISAAAFTAATRNAAGSPTYRLYTSTEIANEVSVGSALVKPTHFDSEALADHRPASFIATPVIKSYERTTMPALEVLDGVQHAWNPNYRRTVYIYGGHWLADPVDPPGLTYNSTWGRSSNQEMLNGGPRTRLAVDEFVFLRPQQSEAVFLQFGDLLVYEDGQIRERWPAFPSSA